MMDNLSAHKVDGVREGIVAAGAELIYLPPYSPDLNPIKKVWSKLKLLLRSVKARTQEAWYLLKCSKFSGFLATFRMTPLASPQGYSSGA